MQQNAAIAEELPKPNHFIFTTRFNNASWEINRAFREQNNIACVYLTPAVINGLPPDAILFVLEMNNETNRITGIGLLKIRNNPKYDKYAIYENYSNTFAYVGGLHISRDEFTEDNEKIIRVFDDICFKGRAHLKRPRGLTRFPVDRLAASGITSRHIANMFKQKMEKPAISCDESSSVTNKIA